MKGTIKLQCVTIALQLADNQLVTIFQMQSSLSGAECTI